MILFRNLSLVKQLLNIIDTVNLHKVSKSDINITTSSLMAVDVNHWMFYFRMIVRPEIQL